MSAHAADRAEHRGHSKDFRYATWSVGIRDLGQPRTRAGGMPVAESNLSLARPREYLLDLRGQRRAAR